MASLRNCIFKILSYNSQGGGRMVSAEVIVANEQAARYTERAIRDELATLLDTGQLCAADGHYARPTKPSDRSLAVETYRGGDSTPWQFSVTRTEDALTITQARGPPEKFDPVIKEFTVKKRPLGAEPIEFHHAVSRRVWQEDPEQPMVKSQRSEGHVIELFYRDPTGRHLTQPEPPDEDTTNGDDADFKPTGHPGLTVASTFLRAEEANDLKFTEEREYRVSAAIFEAYAEVYVLSYYEVNEESFENAQWEVEDAVAHRLVPAAEM
jgi:hypothetical protein